jgi:hypothetical protein
MSEYSAVASVLAQTIAILDRRYPELLTELTDHFVGRAIPGNETAGEDTKRIANILRKAEEARSRTAG